MISSLPLLILILRLLISLDLLAVEVELVEHIHDTLLLPGMALHKVEKLLVVLFPLLPHFNELGASSLEPGLAEGDVIDWVDITSLVVVF